MNRTVPGTDIQIGKWYHATQIPPRLTDGQGMQKYSLLLGVKDLGMIPGIYSESRQSYEWDCQRYAGPPRAGWLSRAEINTRLEWVLEAARGVSCWMVIPDFDNKIASIDGLTGFGLEQDEGPQDQKTNLDTEQKRLDRSDDNLFLQFQLN
ncbi:hypothetical protein [Spirosoma jeollabukense]